MDQLLGIDCHQQSALFLLGLKEGHCLSEVAITSIVSSHVSTFRVRAGIHEQLVKVGIDLNTLPEIDSFLVATLDPLLSTYMQEKFYRENLGCLVSIVSKQLCRMM